MTEQRWQAVVRVAVVGGLLASLLLWCAWDRRPPDDHDLFYTAWALDHLGRAGGDAGGALRSALADVPRSGIHPPLAQLNLLAWFTAGGVSRLVFRAANVKWLLLLLFGTERLGRELVGRRAGLLAMAVVGTLPIVVNSSRKADPYFAAAALAPWGLWLGLVALRRGGGWWAAFGALQALRMSAHPVALPDVVATLAVLSLAGRMTGSRRWAWGLVAAAAAGWPSLVGMSWSLPAYIAERTGYLDAGGLAGLRYAGTWVVEIVRVHLFVGGAALLSLGLLRPRAMVGTPGRRIGCVLLLLQVPPTVLAISNGALWPDFLHLLPGAVVLLLASFESWPGRVQGGWAGGLGLHGAAVVVIPLAMAFTGADPIQQPEAFDRPGLRAFGQSPTGRQLATHHFVVRVPLALDVVVAAVPGTDEPLRLGVADLWWDPGPEFVSRCVVAAPGSTGWTLEPADAMGLGSPWPALLAGRPGADFVPAVAPEADRPLVIRLRVRPGPAECLAVERAPAGLTRAADAWVAGRFPGRTASPVLDPTQELLGIRTEWERDPDYLDRGWLVR